MEPAVSWCPIHVHLAGFRCIPVRVPQLHLRSVHGNALLSPLSTSTSHTRLFPPSYPSPWLCLTTMRDEDPKTAHSVELKDLSPPSGKQTGHF